MNFESSARGSVRWYVKVDGVRLKDAAGNEVYHTLQHKAQQHAEEIEALDPARAVTYEPDFEVEVQATDTGKPTEVLVGSVLHFRLSADPTLAASIDGLTVTIRQEGKITIAAELVP